MDARPARPVSLRARSIALGIGAVMFALVTIGVSAATMNAWQDSLVERSEARVARLEMSELARAITDQDTNIRGFIAARDEQFVEPYRRGVTLERAMIERLGSSGIADEAAFAAQLERLASATARWRADVATLALDPSRPVLTDDVIQDRAALVTAEFDALDEMVTSEEARTVERTDDVQRVAMTVLIGSAVTAVAAIVLVGLLFRRWVTRPLAGIGVAARRMAADDNTPWPDVATAELQDITDAIRGLQRSLTLERDRAVTAYRGLEQSALLALHVRSELANELGEPPPGWSIGSALVPAEGVVAGDCFDSGLLDQQHLYAIMIDVTGHGAMAALDALKVKTQLRAALRSRMEPGAALEWISRQNQRDDDIELFTAVALVIDIRTGECRYANAGHPPPILTDGTHHVPLVGTGPLLGAFAATWRTETVIIESGLTLLLYTDGVTEAMRHDRERFGEDRLGERLRDASIADAAALVDRVLVAVDEFRDGPRTDDLTMLVVHRSAEARPGPPQGVVELERHDDPPILKDTDRPMDTVQS